MYCLWIGAQKIYNLKQLIRHFDFDAVEMYLLGGGLSRWLRQCDETEIAENVDKIDLFGDISKQLSEVFSVKLPKGRSNIPVTAAGDKQIASSQNSSSHFLPCEQVSFILNDANPSSFRPETASAKVRPTCGHPKTLSTKSKINPNFSLRKFMIS